MAVGSADYHDTGCLDCAFVRARAGSTGLFATSDTALGVAAGSADTATSLALAAGGTTLITGAAFGGDNFQGIAHVFDFNPASGTWSYNGDLVDAAGAQFDQAGIAVAVDAAGLVVLVSHSGPF